ncbi:hypothetical protein NFI95_13585 [Acetobacteraceae bacterium KSS8]|uniref:Yip1 domain-containing protein n=1 Tax=Endosaccharibacter trunci TaxID=2812733 RepID=A0ABT1W9B4_9PROT|nr:hypothetical protein [Acetobacteraceae bacterium KSS8]
MISPPSRPSGSPGRRSRAGQIVRGLMLLGTGRAEGLAYFGNGRDAFLGALAPPVAFLIVYGAAILLAQPSLAGLCVVLLFLCGILLPPVLSHLMATLWKRAELWPRYATASIWSNLLLPVAYLPALLLASAVMAFGLDQRVATAVASLAFLAYALWLQWFVAWRGLNLSPLRAVVTVLVVTGVSSVVFAVGMQPFLGLLARIQPGS